MALQNPISLRLAEIFFLCQKMLALTIYTGFLLKGETLNMTFFDFHFKTEKRSTFEMFLSFFLTFEIFLFFFKQCFALMFPNQN